MIGRREGRGKEWIKRGEEEEDGEDRVVDVDHDNKKRVHSKEVIMMMGREGGYIVREGKMKDLD